MSTLEQTSFDAINITDQLVVLSSEAREHAAVMKTGTTRERDAAFEAICDILDKILETAFQVNSVSHDLEKEVVYQRDTIDSIRDIILYLYAVSEEL